MDKRKKKDTNAASDSDINDNVSDNIEITVLPQKSFLDNLRE